MQLSTLARIFDMLFSSSLLADTVTLAWHAGEPLVTPLRFYKHAMQLLAQYNTSNIQVVPFLQTNATLVTQEWCDFIKHYAVEVGVSLDGPQFIHDRSRVDRGGKGTFARAMRGVRLLQENGIEPEMMMVLTRYALDYPEAIWEFFTAHGLNRIAFNIEEVNGAHTTSSLATSDAIEHYKRFLARFLALGERNAHPPLVRDVSTLIARVDALSAPVYSVENVPLAMLSFDYAGNVTTFASELLTMKHAIYKDFLLGNIFETTLEEMLSSQKLADMDAQIQRGVQRCKETCTYFDFCGGGSPVNKLSENGSFDSTETMQCRLRIQATTDVVLEHLENAFGITPGG